MYLGASREETVTMSTYFFATAGPATELDGRSVLAETAQDILAARTDISISAESRALYLEAVSL